MLNMNVSCARPASSFKLLLIPIVLYLQWEFLTPYIDRDLNNPFKPLIFISGHVPTSSKDDPRYAKTYLDLAFIGYYIVVFSCFRQTITGLLAQPFARRHGIKKQAKLDRFGEQAYAVVYFTITGIWGAVRLLAQFQHKPLMKSLWQLIMFQLPTWWYKTDAFWIGALRKVMLLSCGSFCLDYPHWDMKPQLKRYYLMQSAYWCQQLVVLVLRLEKPRKDYYELIFHHIITLWLVGWVQEHLGPHTTTLRRSTIPSWSYLINLTFIGNAVYMSMDIPDAFLAVSGTVLDSDLLSSWSSSFLKFWITCRRKSQRQ